MKRVWIITGRISFVLLWPALYFYLRNTDRTRVVVHSDGYVLVLKNWLGDGRWKLPGGGMHKGEEVRVCAVRELKEETDITILPDQLTPLGAITSRSRGITMTCHCFECSVPERLEPKLTRGEIIAIEWLRADDLLRGRQISATTRRILTIWRDGTF